MIKAWRKRYKIIADKVYKKKEILSFMVRDFGKYTWSLRSLDRRLSYFNIHNSDKSVLVEELMGPGWSLGYRVIH